MARFELSIREPGRTPRVVSLTQQNVVVGRSRRADVTIEDEEVGREQFRLRVDGDAVVIEGIGKTNRTVVDDSVLDPGAVRRLAAGASIRVGKTTFALVAADATQIAIAPSSTPEVTIMSPGPISSGPPTPKTPPPGGDDAKASEQKPEEQTGGAVGPMQTLQMPRPGGARGASPSSTPPPAAAKPPGAPPPAAGPAPAKGSDEGAFDQTMQWKGGFRPGAANAPRAEAKPPTSAPVNPASAGKPAPSKPPAPTPPPAAPPPPPAPAAPAPAPAPAAAASPGASVPRPTTVAIMPESMQSELGLDGAKVLELEARLHEALPRLFVKSDKLKRRIRLLKARCTVGRAETSDVLLPVESVSEMHAEIVFDGASFLLRDCGSTNGTFVDGVQLRGVERELVRHSLVGIGGLRAVFLCNERGRAGSDRRLEERALRLLVAAGRLTRDEGEQIRRVARADTSQSIAEILLMETPLAASDWVTAVTTVRSRKTLWDRIAAMFARLRGGKKTTGR